MNIFKERKIPQFLMVWGILAIVIWQKCYAAEVEIINTTSLAFTYEYGFISRGLIGSIYMLVGDIFSINMIDYDCVMVFTYVATMIYFVILVGFFVLCLMKCTKDMRNKTEYLIFFFSIFAVSMFITRYNFGRYDVYCFMLSLIAAILIICEKAEWLVVPLSAIGVMIHQGNVFYFLNIILILLVYKILSYEGKKRVKYAIIFLLSFGSASALFLYFEFFSHGFGPNYYDVIVETAKALRFDGDYHHDIIDHEILGIDLTERELEYRYKNFTELPFFVLFMSPYLVIAFRFFKNLIKSAQTKLEKVKYLFVAIGSATMIPTIILKCDFGRWMFMIIAYYFVVILALLAMGDKLVEKEVANTADKLKKLGPAIVILFIYAAIFIPFKDVTIANSSFNIADMLNTNFLHLWVE